MATEYHFEFFMTFLKLSKCILSIWTQVIDLRVLSKLGGYSPLENEAKRVSAETSKCLEKRDLIDAILKKTYNQPFAD